MTIESLSKVGVMAGKTLLLIIAFALICAGCLPAAESGGKPALRVLIIPKFEIGEIAGDFPGEAQLFYERYCPGCEEIAVPHMPATAHFYMNADNGVGILVTGSGKTAAGLSPRPLSSMSA